MKNGTRINTDSTDKKIFFILSFDVQAEIQSIAVDIKLWRYDYACKVQMEDPMKRTTIMLPEDLKMRALKHANMMGISLGGFVRESLARALQNQNPDMPVEDPFFADEVVFDGKSPVNLAAKHDDYLYGDRT